MHVVRFDRERDAMEVEHKISLQQERRERRSHSSPSGQDLRSGEVLPPGAASGEPVEKRYFYFRIFSTTIHYFTNMAPLLPHNS